MATDYPALRCACRPGLRCAACRAYVPRRTEPLAPVAPTYPAGLAHLLTAGGRRAARQSEDEKKAALRPALAAWIQEHGRLPLSADFRTGSAWNLDTDAGKVGHHQLYRLYGSIHSLWQDCYEHGLCTREQLVIAQQKKMRAVRKNGIKGRLAQRARA